MKITLSSGYSMPMAIYGTYNIKQTEVKQAIADAIKHGFSHIDAAAVYGNEAEIGETLNEAFGTGLTSRERLYITTKVWPSDYRRVRYACLASLRRLKLDYLDQYLLHWPLALKQQDLDPPVISAETAEIDRYPLHLVWAQMEALVEEGLVKSIGVSNWTVALLNDLLGYAKIKPATNQFEISIYNQRRELVDFCLKENVVPVAYRVFFRPPNNPRYPFQKSGVDHPLILCMAEKYGKTPAQVLLQWCLMRNCAFVTKTVTPARMVENIESQSFALNAEDFEKINTIPFEGQYTDSFRLFRIHIFK